MSYGIRTLKRQPDPDLIERQAAADLVMLARRVTLMRPRLTDEERQQYASRFRALKIEMENAELAMLRGVAENIDVPPFLAPDGPALPPRYLKPDEEARTHE